jgi:uncharacterized protein
LLVSNISIAKTPATGSGIVLDKPWKVTIYQFSKEHLQHSAWGLSHCERNYKLATKLAKMEKLDIDDDVLFAASFLHDMGAFKPYVIKGEEHSRTSANNVEVILQKTDFPMKKLDDVKIAILSHMFYADVPNNPTARVLHDADTLDFLGNIGIARIISVTSRHRWATDLPTALKTIERFNAELPLKLSTTSAKKIATPRVTEAHVFIKSLKAETNSGTTL